MSSWEDEINSVNEEVPIDAEPSIIEETLERGNMLVNVDYLPKIKDIEILKPYLAGRTHLNPYKLGWRFNFGTSKDDWAGLCSVIETNIRKSKNKNIFVSIDFVKHDKGWRQSMDLVIKHEISHAIIRELFYFTEKWATYERLDPAEIMTKGHGKIWSAICEKLNGENCPMFYDAPEENLAEQFKPYRYECYNCGHKEYGYYEGFESNCRECGKAVLTERNPE